VINRNSPQHNLLFAELQLHCYSVGARMAHGVGDRFLTNSKQPLLNLR